MDAIWVHCIASSGRLGDALRGMVLGTYIVVVLKPSRFAVDVVSTSYFEFDPPASSPIGCPTCKLSILLSTPHGGRERVEERKSGGTCIESSKGGTPAALKGVTPRPTSMKGRDAISAPLADRSGGSPHQGAHGSKTRPVPASGLSTHAASLLREAVSAVRPGIRASAAALAPRRESGSSADSATVATSHGPSSHLPLLPSSQGYSTTRLDEPPVTHRPPGLPLIDYCAVVGWAQAGVFAGGGRTSLDAAVATDAGRLWQECGKREGQGTGRTRSHTLWRWPRSDQGHSSLPPQLAPFVVTVLESSKAEVFRAGSSVTSQDRVRLGPAGARSTEARASGLSEEAGGGGSCRRPEQTGEALDLPTAVWMDRTVALVTRIPDPHTRVFAACSKPLRCHRAGVHRAVPASEVDAGARHTRDDFSPPSLDISRLESGSGSHEEGRVQSAGSVLGKACPQFVSVVLLTRSMSSVPFLRGQADRLASLLTESGRERVAPRSSSGIGDVGLDCLVPSVDRLQRCSAPATISPGLRVPEPSQDVDGPGHFYSCIGRTAVNWSGEDIDQAVKSKESGSHSAPEVLRLEHVLPRAPLLGASSPTEMPLRPLAGRGARMSARAVIQVLLGLVAERRTIVVGTSAAMVQGTILGLLELLQPLHWELPVLPIVPQQLLVKLLAAPVPFLYGCTLGAAREALAHLCDEKPLQRSSASLQELRSRCIACRWYRRKPQVGITVVDGDTGRVIQGKLFPAFVAAVCRTEEEPHSSQGRSSRPYTDAPVQLLCSLPHVTQGLLSNEVGNDPFRTPAAAAVAAWGCIARVFAPLLAGAGGYLGWRPRPNASWFQALHMSWARCCEAESSTTIAGQTHDAWTASRYFRRVATSQAAQMLVEHLAAWETASDCTGQETFGSMVAKLEGIRARGLLQLPLRFRELMCIAAVECASGRKYGVRSPAPGCILKPEVDGVIQWCTRQLQRQDGVQRCVAVCDIASGQSGVAFKIRKCCPLQQVHSSGAEDTALARIMVDHGHTRVYLQLYGGRRVETGSIAVFGSALVGAVPCMSPLLAVSRSVSSLPKQLGCLVPFYSSSRGSGAAYLLVRPHLRFPWASLNDTTCEPGTGDLSSSLEHCLFGSREARRYLARIRHSCTAPGEIDGQTCGLPVIDLHKLARTITNGKKEGFAWKAVPTRVVVDVVDALTEAADGDMRSSDHGSSLLRDNGTPTETEQSRTSGGLRSSRSGGGGSRIGRQREASSLSGRQLQSGHDDLSPSARVESGHEGVSGTAFFSSDSRQITPSLDVDFIRFDDDLAAKKAGISADVPPGLSDSEGETDSDSSSISSGQKSTKHLKPAGGAGGPPFGGDDRPKEAGCLDSDREAVLAELEALAAAEPVGCLLLLAATWRYLHMRSISSLHLAIAAVESLSSGVLALPADVSAVLAALTTKVCRIVDSLGLKPDIVVEMLCESCAGPQNARQLLTDACRALVDVHICPPACFAFPSRATASMQLASIHRSPPEPYNPSAWMPVVGSCTSAVTSTSFFVSDGHLVSALAVAGTDGSIQLLCSDATSIQAKWKQVALLQLDKVTAIPTGSALAAAFRRRRASAEGFDFSDRSIVRQPSTEGAGEAVPAPMARGRSIRRIGSMRAGIPGQRDGHMSRGGSFRLGIDTSIGGGKVAQGPSTLPEIPASREISMERAFNGGARALLLLPGAKPGLLVLIAVGSAGECLLCTCSQSGRQGAGETRQSDSGESENLEQDWQLVPRRWLVDAPVLASIRRRRRLCTVHREDLVVSAGIVLQRPTPSESVTETDSYMGGAMCLEVVVGSGPDSQRVGEQTTAKSAGRGAIAEGVRPPAVSRRGTSMGAAMQRIAGAAAGHTRPNAQSGNLRPCRFVVKLHELGQHDTQGGRPRLSIETATHRTCIVGGTSRCCEVIEPSEIYEASGTARSSGFEPSILAFDPGSRLLATTGVPDGKVIRVTVAGSKQRSGFASLPHAADVTSAHATAIGWPTQAREQSSRSQEHRALLATAQADGTVLVWLLRPDHRIETSGAERASSHLQSQLVHKSRCFVSVGQVALVRSGNTSSVDDQGVVVLLAACHDGSVRAWVVRAAAIGAESAARPERIVPFDRPAALLGLRASGESPPSCPRIGLAESNASGDGAVHRVTLIWPCGSTALWDVVLRVEEAMRAPLSEDKASEPGVVSLTSRPAVGNAAVLSSRLVSYYDADEPVAYRGSRSSGLAALVGQSGDGMHPRARSRSASQGSVDREKGVAGAGAGAQVSLFGRPIAGTTVERRIVAARCGETLRLLGSPGEDRTDLLAEGGAASGGGT